MKANAGTFSFTPDTKMDMWAGTKAEMVVPSASESEHLEVNCVAIWQDIKTPPLLLLSIDALYPGVIIRETVEKAALGVPPENIIVGASHSHQAPVADSTKPLLGALDFAFSKVLQIRITELVIEVLNFSKAEDVEMFAGESQAHHSINRRRKMKLSLIARLLNKETIQMAPNPNGVVDETVAVISLRRKDDSEVAKIWNYACHPVSHPTPDIYSSHFIGKVRSYQREQCGNIGLPIIFFQGFSGAARPSASVGASLNLKSLLLRLFDGPTFRQMPKIRYENWAKSLSDILTNTGMNNVQSQGDFVAKRIKVSGEEFAYGKSFSVTFSGVHYQNSIALISASAEVVSEYSQYIRAKSAARVVFCIGCADDTFGYIPTSTMISQGGYEAGGYCKTFSLLSLNPQIELNTKNALERVFNI